MLSDPIGNTYVLPVARPAGKLRRNPPIMLSAPQPPVIAPGAVLSIERTAPTEYNDIAVYKRELLVDLKVIIKSLKSYVSSGLIDRHIVDDSESSII